MEINLNKNEISLLKSLLKKEYADFRENEEDLSLTRPHIVELGLEEKYKEFLESLIQKLQ
ncbi:hypothetical protein J4418_01550 [Candidatus Woesearchaeota archaeon]|nr:hypothetical protein [Candidatus Woesearchaeota archaeon]